MQDVHKNSQRLPKIVPKITVLFIQALVWVMARIAARSEYRL
jgi:hypothetical protein